MKKIAKIIVSLLVAVIMYPVTVLVMTIGYIVGFGQAIAAIWRAK